MCAEGVGRYVVWACQHTLAVTIVDTIAWHEMSVYGHFGAQIKVKAPERVWTADCCVRCRIVFCFKPTNPRTVYNCWLQGHSLQGRRRPPQLGSCHLWCRRCWLWCQRTSGGVSGLPGGATAMAGTVGGASDAAGSGGSSGTATTAVAAAADPLSEAQERLDTLGQLMCAAPPCLPAPHPVHVVERSACVCWRLRYESIAELWHGAAPVPVTSETAASVEGTKKNAKQSQQWADRIGLATALPAHSPGGWGGLSWPVRSRVSIASGVAAAGDGGGGPPHSIRCGGGGARAVDPAGGAGPWRGRSHKSERCRAGAAGLRGGRETGSGHGRCTCVCRATQNGSMLSADGR
jgi:hypothetical protein